MFFKNEVKQERNPIARWSIGSGSINEFSFSPDNTLLAVVSQDGFLRIFNYEKMELVIYMKSYFAGLLCVKVLFFRFISNYSIYILLNRYVGHLMVNILQQAVKMIF